MQIERLGPYQIVGKLGRGGMGTVYEGVNMETGEPAAVKLLSAALAQEEGFRDRFEAEIETLRKLRHPNVVKLFGFGEQDNHLFYAMELIDGNSLEEELSRGRRFDWREVVRIVLEICRALRHAHDRGVIHRDIKPGNLLLAADGQIKLSDFGISRLFGYTRLTSAGSVLGTAEYMAPEQAAGKTVDHRADLYSLGAVMYALLARRSVFRGKSLGEVLYKQQFEMPEPLRKYNADVPEELERIILQLLEKDPDRRIPNATILSRCLEAMQHAMSLPPDTVLADESYYAGEQSSSEAAVTNEAANPPSTAESISLQQADLPATEMLQVAGQSAAVPPIHESAPDALSPTVPTAAIPPQKITVTEAESKKTGHFVTVNEEELGREEFEEQRPAIISIQTWVLMACLILLGMFVWYLLQPPTADRLYERIATTTTNESIESLLQAEDDISQFLQRYPADPRAFKLRRFQREIDLYRLERKFDLRVKGLASTESMLPIERAYLEAIGYARVNPEQCLIKLQALLDLYQYSSDTGGPVGDCLLLARRRLAQLKQEIEKYAADQVDLIQSRLDEADKLVPTDPRRAAAMYRGIIELYSNKPWAADALQRAHAALEKIKKEYGGREKTE